MEMQKSFNHQDEQGARQKTTQKILKKFCLQKQISKIYYMISMQSLLW